MAENREEKRIWAQFVRDLSGGLFERQKYRGYTPGTVFTGHADLLGALGHLGCFVRCCVVGCR
jgi:hypothetical protein